MPNWSRSLPAEMTGTTPAAATFRMTSIIASFAAPALPIREDAEPRRRKRCEDKTREKQQPDCAGAARVVGVDRQCDRVRPGPERRAHPGELYATDPLIRKDLPEGTERSGVPVHRGRIAGLVANLKSRWEDSCSRARLER